MAVRSIFKSGRKFDSLGVIEKNTDEKQRLKWLFFREKRQHNELPFKNHPIFHIDRDSVRGDRKLMQIRVEILSTEGQNFLEVQIS